MLRRNAHGGMDRWQGYEKVEATMMSAFGSADERATAIAELAYRLWEGSRND